jgi:hypothetical protein
MPQLSGENHPKARLTDEQVAKMRRMYKPRVVSYKTLAEEFGCSWRTVCDIVHYRTRGSAGE